MFKKFFIFLIPILMCNSSYAKLLTGEEISKKYPRIQKMYVDYQYQIEGGSEEDNLAQPIGSALGEIYKIGKHSCIAVFTLENDSKTAVYEDVIFFNGKKLRSGYSNTYEYEHNSDGELISHKRTYTDPEPLVTEEDKKSFNSELEREFKLIQEKMTKKTLKQCS